jgi:hypothetical protein
VLISDTELTGMKSIYCATIHPVLFRAGRVLVQLSFLLPPRKSFQYLLRGYDPNYTP